MPLADCSVLPASCHRHALPELLSKKVTSVPVFLKCPLDPISSLLRALQ